MKEVDEFIEHLHTSSVLISSLRSRHQTGRIARQPLTEYPFQNPNVEIRNSKQYQMTEIPMSETAFCAAAFFIHSEIVCFCHWNIRALNLFRISCFEFRIFRSSYVWASLFTFESTAVLFHCLTVLSHQDPDDLVEACPSGTLQEHKIVLLHNRPDALRHVFVRPRHRSPVRRKPVL